MYGEFKDALTERLFSERDEQYRKFHSKLVPGMDSEKIIGVRTPVLRTLAKELFKNEENKENIKAFMSDLPHRYYEENNLHAFFIEQIKDPDTCSEAIEAFLPYVDNWATCDMMRPAALAKDREKLYCRICRWMSSEHTYTVRYGIEMLMLCFLGDDFSEKYIEKVAELRSDEYYVNMMRAWYFAEALSKQYESAVKYLENCRLDLFTHNKAIQKAKESFKIDIEKKRYLVSLKLRKSET
ncbi:MAG: DNA alkylation repair protein [Ruminococcaceae bacterium]|nr:DNA alkylation repair protein [Oscillospiraceae bacterium]